MKDIIGICRKNIKLIGILGVVVALSGIVLLFAAQSASDPILAEPLTESEITFDMEKNRVYTAADGVVIVQSTVDSGELTVDKTETSGQSEKLSTINYALSTKYTLPEDAQMADGSIGLLTIPAIRLKANVYETESEMESMSRGVAHFKTTSAWFGNVGLCSHNVNFDLTDGLFKNLHTLKSGDAITYKTALGSRIYSVETVAEIAETDWSYLGRTVDDRITLVTCISGKPRMRLVVQAVAE